VRSCSGDCLQHSDHSVTTHNAEQSVSADNNKEEKTEKCGNCDALQLEAARLRASHSALWDADAKIEVSQPINCCLIAFLLLILYVTLWP